MSDEKSAVQTLGDNELAESQTPSGLDDVEEVQVVPGLPVLPDMRKFDPENPQEGVEDPFDPLTARERQIALGIKLHREGMPLATAARKAGLARTTLRHAYARTLDTFNEKEEDRKTKLARMDERVLGQLYAISEATNLGLMEELVSGRIQGKDMITAMGTANKALSEVRGYRWREPAGEGTNFNAIMDRFAQIEGNATLELKLTKDSNAAKEEGGDTIDVTPYQLDDDS